ncbi:hypothetical protein SteCoe_21919 [Stentor coeruleus]|uniref:Uncharacterized protein n=1 Tax=Stentor coeruleus TaxID=5963 RepID=A0A1R2BND5_9CILI|nr:hypothetical protein SteCoe_21919 [Stentor coeruleus]
MGACLTKKSKAQILKEIYIQESTKKDFIVDMKRQIYENKALEAPKLKLQTNISYKKRMMAKHLGNAILTSSNAVSAEF